MTESVFLVALFQSHVSPGTPVPDDEFNFARDRISEHGGPNVTLTPDQITAEFSDPVVAAGCAVALETSVAATAAQHRIEIGIAENEHEALHRAGKGTTSDITVTGGIARKLKDLYSDDLERRDDGDYELLYGTSWQRINAPFDCVFAAEADGWLKHRKGRASLSSPARPSVHNELSGLALSGGGMRSGVFSLGFLQEIAKQHDLETFDYLSTVSGGGYAGTSLQALCAEPLPYPDTDTNGASYLDDTHEGFPFRQFPYRGAHRHHEGSDAYKPVHGVESPATRHVREHANMLGSSPGLLSTELWAAAGSYLISTALLFVMFVLPIVAVLAAALVLPAKAEAASGWKPFWDRPHPWHDMWWNWDSIPWLVVVALVIGLTVHLTLSLLPAYVYRDPTDGLNRIAAHVQSFIVKWCLAFAALLAVIATIWFVSWSATEAGAWISKRGLIGTVTAVAGAGATAAILKAMTTVVRPSAVVGPISRILMAIGGYAILILVFGATYVTVWNFRDTDPVWFPGTMDLEYVVLVLGVAGIAAAMCYPLQALGFLSIADLYRFRIERTWIMRARPRPGSAPPTFTHEWTDVSTARDLKVRQLAAHIGEANPPRTPYPLICCAINMPGDTNKKLFDRKSDSFLISPFYSGSHTTRWRPTGEMDDTKSMSLGVAAAISGAAVSPIMGSATSATASIGLTLLNVRLGRWMRNPVGQRGPSWLTLAFRYYTKELFGAARRKDRLIYVSDGGHFDNTGLYELFRRRCKLMVFVDSCGEDPPPGQLKYGALATVLRMARVDFGVEVDLDVTKIEQKPSGASESLVAIGPIRYPDSPAAQHGGTEVLGTLIVVKPGLLPPDKLRAPDILSYARGTNRRFPRDSTADQQYDQPQFESYRRLGELAAREYLKQRELYTSLMWAGSPTAVSPNGDAPGGVPAASGPAPAPAPVSAPATPPINGATEPPSA